MIDINKEHYQALGYEKTDGLMIKVLWWHFAVLALGALAIYYFQPANFYPNPFSWRSLTIGETVGAILVGFLASLIPTLLRNRIANHYFYRLIVTAAFMVYSFLIVLVSGGSIEMHFYLFGVWALLTLYYDRRLIWAGFFLMFLHRAILNYTIPLWLYHYGRNDVSLLAHTIFALLAAIFTARIAESARQSIIKLKEANSLLESKIKT